MLKTLYGASSMFYSGTSYGAKVEGAPSTVREFSVVGETSRSYVLQNGVKVSKTRMEYNAGNFIILMFESVEQAINAIRDRKA